MKVTVIRLLAATAWLAATVTLALPAIRSEAQMNSVSTNRANSVTADSPSNYLRLYSQSTDPAGLTGYGVKRGSSPAVPAATGADLALTAALGGYKNQNTTSVTRVLTLQALNPLPAGASPLTVTAALTAALGGYKNQNTTSVTRVLTLQALNPLPAGASPLTVTAALAADPVTGRQPLTGATFSALDGSGAGPTATLTAGAKRQLNLTVRTQPNNVFPGNNVLHTPTVTLRVTYPGYTGTFLTFVVPVSVWDGNGAGP